MALVVERGWIVTFAVLVLASITPAGEPGPEWNARNAEHLFNRAGFGATPEQLTWALGKTPEEVVDRLLAGLEEHEGTFPYEVHQRPREADFEDKHDYFEAYAEMRRRERRVMADYAGWWMQAMVASDDPLREKMVLFWHNHFVSSETTVLSYAGMIAQNQLFRREGLGNFGKLLHDIVRDPAMIVYLDNDQNAVGKPNENLAREIMELFALGIGNYTEQDIKEGARALTGWRVDDVRTRASFVKRLHDEDSKKILGHEGNFGADEFVDILLAQPACSRFIAGKLLAYFEGVTPDAARRQEYADSLVESHWELAPLLRKLFLDPRFYRDEIRGQRIAAPVEYVVGMTRRLGLTVPPRLLVLSASQLGQRLFEPPNVKGWEEGDAWIRTSTMMARGNVAGVLLGLVNPGVVIQEQRIDGMSLMDDESVTTYVPELDLRAWLEHVDAASDTAVVDALADRLLAVPLTERTRAALLRFLAAERERMQVKGSWSDMGADAEAVLRRLAHLILSSPEGQLV